MTLADDLAAAARDGQTFTPGLWKGDVREWLDRIGENKAHAIITDPPYGIGFMGKEWDSGKSFVERKADKGNPWDHVGGNHNPVNSADAARTRRVEGQRFQAWFTEIAADLLRILRPGGHALVFSSTRTFHRIACAMEDAGFEIRDTIMWCYGSGFPKSLDVGKATPAAAQWDGWGTALKPALEPIIVARKPLRGTVAQNVQAWETGGLHIDACRVATTEDLNGGTYYGSKRPSNDMGYRYGNGTGREFVQPDGRWPANLLLSCDCPGPEGEHSEPWCPVLQLDAQSGSRPSNGGRVSDSGMFGMRAQADVQTGYGDTGGASRFFYTGKAPRRERPEYVFEQSLFTTAELAAFEAQGFDLPADGTRIVHPTVKPQAIMRWLCRLVTPPNGLIVDPFLGTGSTAEAAAAEGFRWTGAERHLPYWPLIEQRVERVKQRRAS